MRFCSLIRQQPHYRHDAFISGFKAIGAVESGANDCDVLAVWNRYGTWDKLASDVERRGGTVLVAENGYLGNDFAGSRWYAIARSHHNGAGTWRFGGPERWDRLNIELAPWRQEGKEIVILPQRGIGPKGIAMPGNWARETLEKLQRLTRIKARIREHPGVNACVPLEHDLAKAWAVVTWGSGAALKALAMGIPVFYDFPQWIGARAARPLSQFGTGPLRDDVSRLAMFRRLAWAQWTVEEIAAGTAFRWLCAS